MMEQIWPPAVEFDADLHRQIAATRADILARIASAAQGAGREPQSIRLTAVSKTQVPARIAAALAAGQRIFGENRVQEAITRWRGTRESLPDLHLRLIGPLQSNKLAEAMALFDAIETLDRPKLARLIADSALKTGRMPEIFVQINIGEEVQKAGIPPGEADAFIAACRGEYGLNIAGLMAIPPVDSAPIPFFVRLREIAARNGIEHLSMGMSGDFETAIACGATLVRVGSGLFGTRV